MSKLTEAAGSIRRMDELAEGHSAVHDIHPLAKLWVTLFYVVIVISFERYDLTGLFPFLFYPVIMMALGEIPAGPLLKRMLIAVPFAFFAGISNVFFDKEILLMVLGVPVSGGVISFLTLMFKTLLTVMAVLILAASTPLTELSYQLLRLKVPPIFIMQLTMTYRYISVLLEEASVMYCGYILRNSGEKGIRMRDMGTFAGQLLLRSMERGERIYSAMKCRGFDGVCRFSAAGKAVGKDYVFGLLPLVFLALRLWNVSVLLGQAVL